MHAGTSKNDWVPCRGDRNDLGVQLATVIGGSSNRSEESILPREVLDGKGVLVRKVTNYDVSYR